MAYYLAPAEGGEPVSREDQIRLAALELAISIWGMREANAPQIVVAAETFRAFLAGEISPLEVRERVAKGTMTLNDARTALAEGGDR